MHAVQNDIWCLSNTLLIGPKYNQKVCRFHVHQVVVIADIKKLFLRIGVAEKDRHALRFLWGNDTNDQNPVVQLTINNNQNNINNIKDQNPIPKTSAPSSAKEYRPISLLSLIPKLLGTRRCSWHIEVLKLLLEPLLHLPWLKQVTRWNFQRYNVSLQWFRRNLLKWPTFWDSHESAVHNSSELNYLQSLLDGAAYEAIYIAGLTLSSVNYNEVDRILRRGGNERLIIDRHMDALLSLHVSANDQCSHVR